MWESSPFQNTAPIGKQNCIMKLSFTGNQSKPWRCHYIVQSTFPLSVEVKAHIYWHFNDTLLLFNRGSFSVFYLNDNYQHCVSLEPTTLSHSVTKCNNQYKTWNDCYMEANWMSVMAPGPVKVCFIYFFFHFFNSFLTLKGTVLWWWTQWNIYYVTGMTDTLEEFTRLCCCSGFVVRGHWN